MTKLVTLAAVAVSMAFVSCASAPKKEACSSCCEKTPAKKECCEKKK